MQCKMRCMRLDGSDRWECMVLVPGRSFMLLAGCWVVASLVRCGRDKVRFAAGRPRPGPVPAAAPHPCCCPCDLTVESLSAAARTHRSSHATHGAALHLHAWAARALSSIDLDPAVQERSRQGEASAALPFFHTPDSDRPRLPPARPASIPARAHPRR